MRTFGHSLVGLIPHVLPVPYDSIAVLDPKLYDSLRRRSGDGYRRYEVENRAELDKLLDYFQAMEALLSIEGSYQIVLYAAVLLGSAGGNRVVTAADTFEFIKDMHTIRNAVIHGRHADVIASIVAVQAQVDAF
jgi:hypothetical protein